LFAVLLPHQPLFLFRISALLLDQLLCFLIAAILLFVSFSTALLLDQLLCFWISWFAFCQLFHFRISRSSSWSAALLPDRLFAFYQLFYFRISRSSSWSAALLLDQLVCFSLAVLLPHQPLFFFISSASWSAVCFLSAVPFPHQPWSAALIPDCSRFAFCQLSLFRISCSSSWSAILLLDSQFAKSLLLNKLFCVFYSHFISISCSFKGVFL
jgi:hypothetical protein